MWVWKISQHACGRFLRSSYNPTEWDWNPGFPHYSRGKTTDLGFVGHVMEESYKVEQLKGSPDYRTWKFSMKMLLETKHPELTTREKGNENFGAANFAM